LSFVKKFSELQEVADSCGKLQEVADSGRKFKKLSTTCNFLKTICNFPQVSETLKLLYPDA
jgi:hypothetical protein